MPLFVCSKCDAVDNTALALYWGQEKTPLCSACAPAKFEDGTPTGLGVWHGKFPKKQWDPETEPLRPNSRMLVR